MAAIAQVVQGLPEFRDPDLLVGAEHFSDAAVYRIDASTAIVQSLDFFPPLVDDPFIFGQIAAANSMSDVYAMGAAPKTALNIVGFPDKELSLDVLSEILRGGADSVREAGALIVGGHSVRDVEIKYGLSVTGIVDPAKMMTNKDAKPGDVLVLTKGLGTGFITTANRADACPDDVLEAACASMVMLNAAASQAAIDLGVRAATDITGFGLAGHATEMAMAGNVRIELELSKLPLLLGALELSREGNHTRANATNREFIDSSLTIDGAAEADERSEFLFDPQTSGGLLIAIEPTKADELVKRCQDGGMEMTAIVGGVEPVADDGVHLRIRP